MASQLEEIRRLRAEVKAAEERASRAEAERDDAKTDYAALAGLTQRYIEAKDSTDERPEHERQLGRYQQGWQDCERYVDGLTRDGMALDQHGRLRVLEVPTELPEPLSLDERIAEADDWARREAQWQWDQHGREHAERQRAEQQKADTAELHHYRAERAQQVRPPKGDREMAS